MIFLCVVHNLGAPRSGKNEWSGSSRTMTRRAFSGRACFSWSQTTHCFYISITSRGLIQCLKQTVCHLHAILSHQSLTSSHHTKWRGVKTSQVKFALVTEHIHTSHEMLRNKSKVVNTGNGHLSTNGLRAQRKCPPCPLSAIIQECQKLSHPTGTKPTSVLWVQAWNHPTPIATQYPYIPLIVVDQVDNIILLLETETRTSASPLPCPADIVTRYPDNRTMIPHASSWHHGWVSVAPAMEHPTPNDK